MTFTEAAIEVLRREGKPLHFRKITEIAVRDSLLDHVGKIPEETMADQLAAHCRLPHTDRRLLPVQHGTFALVEWGLDEDPQGMEALIEPPPEGDPAYRGQERHPIPSRDLARTTGRGEPSRRREREEERRGKRYPPPAEVAYEILAGAGKPLPLGDVAALGAERLLMPDAFVRDVASLQAALIEDNRRREGSGRKPLFQVEGDAVGLVAQPEPGERPAPVTPARAPASTAELRRAALAAFRRRLRECDGPTVEYVAARALEKLDYRELKVAKRGREHVIYTARRRMGIADVRHCIRIIRSGADAGRRDIADLRRDLGHYGAQIGLVLTAGEAGRDARGEASAAGQLPILLICGEALAEALADAGVGCVPVVVPEVDDAFFRTAAEAAAHEEAARRARREERERRERREAPEPEERRAEERRGDQGAEEARPLEALQEPEASQRGAPLAEAQVPAELDARAEAEEDGDEGEEAEGGPEVEGVPGEGAQVEGTPGDQRKRRRRRRRRRGGRGRGREAGVPGAAAAGNQGPPGAAQGTQAMGGSEGTPADAPQLPPSPPAEPPDGGDGGPRSA
jgi:ribonuclease E